MEKVFAGHYRVRYYEADFRGGLRPVTLLDYLQDAASGDSQRTGFSVMDLRRMNMTWVLSRYHVKIARYPDVGESINVLTWRSGINGHFAMREFEVSDDGGNILALATSSWAIVNLETKRPARIDSVVSGLPILERRALDDNFRSLSKMDDWDLVRKFHVRMADLDLNRHVNNTVYAGWALESVPDDIQQGFRLSEIEISYRAEAFFGDTVTARTGKTGGYGHTKHFLHQLINEGNGRELTRLKTVWEPVG